MTTFYMNVNHLTDLTIDEKKTLLGARQEKAKKTTTKKIIKKTTTKKSETIAPSTAISTVSPSGSLDWRNTPGMIQPVRDQGGCG